MSRRYSRVEKEKWQAPPELPQKKPPVRIPANDNEDLIEANRLTLIGRLTNTSVQKPRAVIDFMAQVWNLEGRIVGRALGLDKFIKFETEQELTQVLEKGPYHYKRWMLLLEKWKPTVSDNFPSNISFNVRIHGIPLHFWSEKTILTIGRELGKCSLRDEKEAKIWVEVNGLQPLTMTMEIELPSDEVTGVEFEYIKIEKHCFTCFSLFHEESDCPQRPANAPPPKERKLGITQSIALQRIEAEKKRHDDRRGYSRPTDARSSLRSADDSYTQQRRGGHRTESGRYHARRDDQGREHSILSRTARSNSAYYKSNAPSLQYRVVDRSRLSSGSSTPHQNQGGQTEGLETRGSNPLNARPPPRIPVQEVTPTRTLKERLGPSSDRAGTKSGSKERRSALERLSESNASREQIRKTPSFESGRLQLDESRAVDNMIIDQATREEQSPTDRIPATLRLGTSSDAQVHSNRRGAIPVAALSKTATKRRITKTQKRVVRSPLQVPSLKKQSMVRAATSTRRKLTVDKDNNLPCNKVGTSNVGTSTQRKKNGQPTTVIIPGMTRVPPIGLSGGLSLMWNDDTEITILESSPNLIDTRIVYKGITSFVSFIYGAPAVENRADFWNKLNAVGQNRDDPWLITGDFNDILNNTEKCGGPTRPEGSFTAFRSFVAQNGLWDLKHTGEQLSWRGNRSFPNGEVPILANQKERHVPFQQSTNRTGGDYTVD
ncbi:Uncharacterized protein Rs2_25582 [Raphanus sativus]|nr:Uncharacterized protein Rs2_25582 [Raphanus sativus]